MEDCQLCAGGSECGGSSGGLDVQATVALAGFRGGTGIGMHVCPSATIEETEISAGLILQRCGLEVMGRSGRQTLFPRVGAHEQEVE